MIKPYKNLILGRVIVLAMALALYACSEAKPRVQDTLMVGRSQDAVNIDPAFAVHSSDSTIVELAYERLLAQVYVDGVPQQRFEGELAESWSSNEAGTEWTFNLHKDHYFDDGTPVTAQAYMFSFERDLKLNPSVVANLFWLEHQEVVDDHTLKIYLKFPLPNFLYFVALGTSVVNPAIMVHEKDGDLAAGWLSENTSGSGAYKVLRWGRGQSMEMAVNTYAAHKPRYFKKLVFRVVKDAAMRRTAMEKGEIDIFEGVTAQTVEDVSHIKNTRLISAPSPRLNSLQLNNKHPQLKDSRIRRAIALAIDYQGLVERVMNGHAQLMNGPIPPGVPGYDPDKANFSRDVEAAKTLLAEAGYGEGAPDKSLAFTLSYVSFDPTFDARALVIQSNLADVGIQLNLERLTAAAALDKAFNGEFELFLSRYAIGFSDPWIAMHLHYHTSFQGSGGNIDFYSNPDVDALLDKAMFERDEAKRIELYQDAQKILITEMPRAFLFASNGLLALRDDIAGVEYSVWRPSVYNIEDMYRQQN